MRLHVFLHVGDIKTVCALRNPPHDHLAIHRRQQPIADPECAHLQLRRWKGTWNAHMIHSTHVLFLCVRDCYLLPGTPYPSDLNQANDPKTTL
jgi:hypothetical protein